MNSASVRIALWPIARLDLFYTALVFKFKAAPEETGFRGALSPSRLIGLVDDPCLGYNCAMEGGILYWPTDTN